MKKTFLYKFSFVLLISFTFSCTPMSKITFLNEETNNEWNINPTPPKHYLEIGDILVVKVLSFDEETTNFFNVENMKYIKKQSKMIRKYFNFISIDTTVII